MAEPPSGMQLCPNCENPFVPNGHDYCRRACKDEAEARERNDFAIRTSGLRSVSRLSVMAALLSAKLGGFSPPINRRKRY